ncbi:MAG: SDR family NAD(P)-dependent oxidoreductase [Spirosomataceae bacterium]
MSDRLIVVTGSSRGLGKALIDTFLSASATDRIIGVARTPTAHPSARFMGLEGDLSSVEGCESLLSVIAKVIDTYPLDAVVLINNAGRLGEVEPSYRTSPYDVAQTIFVNLTVPMLLQNGLLSLCVNRSLPLEIVNILSGAALKAYDGWSGYCSSKAGLLMASQVMALEITQRHLSAKVWSFAPGVIDTAMQSSLRSRSAEQFPEVERFRRLYAEGQLRSPRSVAAFLYQAVGNEDFQNGGFYDIRHF